MKKCKKCGIEKELTEFTDCPNGRKYKDKKYSYCKDCNFKYFKRYRTGKNEFKYKESRAKYRDENRILIRKNACIRAKSRRFKTLVIAANGRARRKYNDNNVITAWQLFHLAHKQKLICPISGIKLNNNNISVDHIIAFANGGQNIISNIQLIDKDINDMKNSHSMGEFIDLINKIYHHQKEKSPLSDGQTH